VTLLQRIRLAFTPKRYQGPTCCTACGEDLRTVSCSRGSGEWDLAHKDPWAWLRVGDQK
jgi:hypothetical protein